MITFDRVSKTYPGGVDAVCDLSMEVAEAETLVLVGTSGSGKTTAMKMVNRLIEPTSGRILIDGTDVREQNPIHLRRKIGYAIQHIGLFPHMTVGDNIAVVPRLLRWSKERTAQRVDELLTMVGLEPEEFRDRFPAQLSGGQQQRVGVARSLSADPPIVLMDEPFGALDPITREDLQNEFMELQSELRKTIVFVTHDIFEAVRMGDRIALLDAGHLQQLAAPAELVENPANDFVDQFLGRHRFQLSLLTKTIETILSTLEHADFAPVDAPPAERLHVRDSLIEALDMFKKTGRSVLPVYERDRFLDNLAKKRLLKVITEVLGEAEVTS